MAARNRQILVAVVLLAGFGWGLGHLFSMRFEQGDVYPPYSTLRADPLGAMALYEGLERMDGVDSQRSFRSPSKIEDPAEVALFFLGVGLSDKTVGATAEELEAVAAAGGRLVIGLLAEAKVTWETELEETDPDRARKRDGRDDRRDAMKAFLGPGEASFLSLLERWGIETERTDIPMNPDGSFGEFHVDRGEDLAPLPERLAWHTAVVFRNPSDKWRTIYGRNGRGAIVERPWGRGEIVLVADSYPFSNEAVARDREPELLAWMTGGRRRVVFDERHHDVSEKPGLMSLAAAYGLRGAVLALIVLAGLLVWRNSSSLVPPYPDDLPEGPDERGAGRDVASGLVHLLRRSIPRGDVLRVCYEEWRRSALLDRPGQQAKAEAMRAVLETDLAAPRPVRDPVEAYRQMCQALARPIAVAAHPATAEAQPRNERDGSQREGGAT